MAQPRKELEKKKSRGVLSNKKAGSAPKPKKRPKDKMRGFPVVDASGGLKGRKRSRGMK